MRRILYALFIIAFIFSMINGCASSSQLVAEKSGAQLWGENCQRCHNIPPPTAFNDIQWDVIGTHMQIRANLTSDEERKIIEFVKSAN